MMYAFIMTTKGFATNVFEPLTNYNLLCMPVAIYQNK